MGVSAIENRRLAAAMNEYPDARAYHRTGWHFQLSAAWTSSWLPNLTAVPIAWPDVADLVELVSTSADDALAGIGMQQVDIEGINELGEEVTETVDLAGLTPVDSVNKYLAINAMSAKAVGSNNRNVGPINLTHKASGGFLSQITELQFFNRNSHATLMLPTDRAGLVWYGGACQGGACSYRLRVKAPGGVWQVVDEVATFTSMSNTPAYAREDIQPHTVPAGSRIEVQNLAPIAGITGAAWLDVLSVPA